MSRRTLGTSTTAYYAERQIKAIVKCALVVVARSCRQIQTSRRTPIGLGYRQTARGRTFAVGTSITCAAGQRQLSSGMTPNAPTARTCSLCGKGMIPQQCLTPLSFLIKSAVKADITIDKKNAYLHFPKCSTALGKMIRDKHHRVPYNRPPIEPKEPNK